MQMGCLSKCNLQVMHISTAYLPPCHSKHGQRLQVRFAVGSANTAVTAGCMTHAQTSERTSHIRLTDNIKLLIGC